MRNEFSGWKPTAHLSKNGWRGQNTMKNIEKEKNLFILSVCITCTNFILYILFTQQFKSHVHVQDSQIMLDWIALKSYGKMKTIQSLAIMVSTLYSSIGSSFASFQKRFAETTSSRTHYHPLIFYQSYCRYFLSNLWSKSWTCAVLWRGINYGWVVKVLLLAFALIVSDWVLHG